MVAIRSADADSFIAKLPTHIFIFLVFGNDLGLISERSAALLRKLVDDPRDALQVVPLSGDQISSDPLLLLDEAHSISMFGGRKAISIDVGLKALTTALQPLVQTIPVNCSVVLRAGALKKDSALRIMLEREKFSASIECSPDTRTDIMSLVTDAATCSGMTVTSEAMEYLIKFLGADRLSTRSEVEKLILYCHGKTEIGIADIDDIVADASLLIIDALLHAAFTGNIVAMDAMISRATSTDAEVSLLMMIALRHAQTLHRTSLEAGTGGYGYRQNDATARHGKMQEQLKHWKSTGLQQAVLLVSEAIAKIRRDPSLSKVTAARCFWSIARLGRKLL